ncbi:MAG: hypothetical protein AABY16_03930 [Nanoarchaeota archaeon]
MVEVKKKMEKGGMSKQLLIRELIQVHKKSLIKSPLTSPSVLMNLAGL